VPDVLTLKTAHFELTVWTKDIDKSQDLLIKTHITRGALLPTGLLRFNPALIIENVTPTTPLLTVVKPITELVLPNALFFENKQYEFDFLFFKGINTSSHSPVIIHRLSRIEEGFHYKQNSLRGSVNFGNDIGWFRLGLRYQITGREVIQYLSFEVQPVKMAMAQDLNIIHSIIDAYYPLWRFSFVQKTDQELAKSRKPHERFALLWLAHFESLRTDLEVGIKRICNAPHTRLLPYQHHVRAERLRGRLSAKLEERVTGHIVSGETQHHYQITRQRLSLDTPENRFIKMVLTRCSQDIARFKKRAEQEDSLRKNGGRLSGAFFTELDQWKRPLDQLLNRPLFAEVGAFDGQTSESLVLHQRNGYSGVYRIWQELKLYLDLFGSHANISMKSVAELYEVWCLLEIRRLLLDLGFTEKIHHHALLKNNGLEKSLKDGIGAAFHLERADGIKIRLAHEPIFLRTNNPSFGKIYSWTTVQKPDIFLEATFKDKERVQWIFDAKYRIADDEKGNNLAPDDAINQMHRYRDALIYINEANDGEPEKSRPILGAFVFYPGWFDEANTINPYQDAIEAVGIGGFPLLPGRDNQWLRDFLVGRFGDRNVTYPIAEADQYFIEESARIGTMGMQHVRYSDLTLAAPMGPIKGRDKDYLQRFKEGLAGWYHIRLSATEKKSIARHVMREVRYCAIAVYHGGGAERIITHIYEVKSVKLVKRCDMTIHQAGKVDSGNDKDYWLLELGYARPLAQAFIMKGLRSFRFQLTNAKELLVAKNWDDLPKRYTTVI
jgi:hypothetical protein